MGPIYRSRPLLAFITASRCRPCLPWTTMRFCLILSWPQCYASTISRMGLLWVCCSRWCSEPLSVPHFPALLPERSPHLLLPSSPLPVFPCVLVVLGSGPLTTLHCVSGQAPLESSMKRKSSSTRLREGDSRPPTRHRLHSPIGSQVSPQPQSPKEQLGAQGLGREGVAEATEGVVGSLEIEWSCTSSSTCRLGFSLCGLRHV